MGKVSDTTKLSNRKPCSPIVKPNGLYTSPIYGKHKPLCFHLFPLYFRSFVSLSLSLFTPSFVSRSSFLPCSSYALASLACASFVFVFLSPLFCLFPDLLSFLTSLSLDFPPLLVFPYLPFWSFRVSYFAKFLELVLSFGFSQIDSQVRF
jgi:hypothetical protein